MQIAVLLTCYNRRATTLSCLTALSAQFLPRATQITIYLVDDGCTDRTAEAVSERFPDVRIILGTGELYWSGGMRAAWDAASADAKYDCYLWLNDDVTLFPGAVNGLVASWQEASSMRRPGLILGSTCDPDTNDLTYGGYNGDDIVKPSSELQTCERINGNIVLVPQEVFNVVGKLSLEFSHIFGDMDYGYRARKAGFELWIAPGFLGTCRGNPCPKWADPGVPFRERWRSLHSRAAYPPRENFLFCTRHYHWDTPVRLLKLYLRVISPGSWQRLKVATGRI